jgi:hypothetical protein
MSKEATSNHAEAFISYSSRDREVVLEIAHQLESCGVRAWIDREKIYGGANYGPEIVEGIKNCKVLLLMCSDASMRSRNVKQEIQLAWTYERPYLPILLESISFPEQVQYWLEGWQWIEVLSRPADQWLPQVLESLERIGVRYNGSNHGLSKVESVTPKQTRHSLEGLRAVAKFTDRFWTVPAESVKDDERRSLRDLGEAQGHLQHSFRLGSRACLMIESEREGHLLLLDEGTSGKIYCLCPSLFAPESRISREQSYLPQTASNYDSFLITGRPGREHLLAIITDEPLGFDWMPNDPKQPARELDQTDIEALLTSLNSLEANRWTAMSTYFDVKG